MRYFTDNPLERMMMQVPRQERGPDLSRPAKGHPLPRLQTLWGGLHPALLPGRDRTESNETQRKERETHEPTCDCREALRCTEHRLCWGQ